MRVNKRVELSYLSAKMQRNTELERIILKSVQIRKLLISSVEELTNQLNKLEKLRNIRN